MELEALQDSLAAITDRGANLIAVSPQKVTINKETVDRLELEYPILSDGGNRYASTLGLVHQLPEDLRQVYTRFGLDLPGTNGDESWTLPLPTRMVVSPGGLLVDLRADPDYTVRPDPSETVALLDRLTGDPFPPG